MIAAATTGLREPVRRRLSRFRFGSTDGGARTRLAAARTINDIHETMRARI